MVVSFRLRAVPSCRTSLRVRSTAATPHCSSARDYSGQNRGGYRERLVAPWQFRFGKRSRAAGRQDALELLAILRRRGLFRQLADGSNVPGVSPRGHAPRYRESPDHAPRGSRLPSAEPGPYPDLDLRGWPGCVVQVPISRQPLRAPWPDFRCPVAIPRATQWAGAWRVGTDLRRTVLSRTAAAPQAVDISDCSTAQSGVPFGTIVWRKCQ